MLVCVAQVSKADLLDFPELPSVPVDTPMGSNTPQDDDDVSGAKSKLGTRYAAANFVFTVTNIKECS